MSELKNIGASVHQRLKNVSKESGRSFPRSVLRAGKMALSIVAVRARESFHPERGVDARGMACSDPAGDP